MSGFLSTPLFLSFNQSLTPQPSRYELAIMKDPPLRVVVGTDAYKAIFDKLKTYNENYKKYEKISNSTDVDGYQAPN